MKYVIETTKEGCLETLMLSDGSTYTRKSKKERFGYSQLDDDFSDQMRDDGICEEIYERVYTVFDIGLPYDFLDLAEMEDQ